MESKNQIAAVKNTHILNKSRDCLIQVFMFLNHDELYNSQLACKYFYQEIVPQLMLKNKFYVIIMPPRSVLKKEAAFMFRGQIMPQ